MEPGAKRLPVERTHAPSAGQTRLFHAWTVAIFFTCFFLYAWLQIEPAIEYYTDGIAFSLSRRFFYRFITYPGGLTDYAGAFLAQLNYHDWLGALVFTVLALGLFAEALWLFRSATRRNPILVSILPALILLAWRGRYDGHALTGGLMVCVALGGALASKPLSRASAWLRWPACLVISLAVYYLAGLWSLALSLALGVSLELVGVAVLRPPGRGERREPSEVLKNAPSPLLQPAPVGDKRQEPSSAPAFKGRKWLNALGLTVTAALVPLVWHYCHLPEKSLNSRGTGVPLFFAVLLFLILPASFVLLSTIPIPNASWASNDEAQDPGKNKTRRDNKTTARQTSVDWAKPALASGALLAGFMLVYLATDRTRKALDTIEYCGVTRQDDRLLAVAARVKNLPPDAEIRAHLALYHTGRLLQNLFTLPNGGSDDLLPSLSMGMTVRRPEGQTLLELGQVNDAEHQAQEGLEYEGNRPDILRALAEVNILKDRPRAAAVFLHILSEVPFQRIWARAWLAELDRNPRLVGHTDLDLIRSRMPTTDLPHTAVPVEDSLLQLLDSNPRNQMAFEYLMAYYLLKGDFRKLAQHLGQLDQFGYTSVPRNIEEALLLGQKLYEIQFDLHGRRIQPDTIQRFQTFAKALETTSKPAASVIASLNSQFGDTFWCYYCSRMR